MFLLKNLLTPLPAKQLGSWSELGPPKEPFHLGPHSVCLFSVGLCCPLLPGFCVALHLQESSWFPQGQSLCYLISVLSWPLLLSLQGGDSTPICSTCPPSALSDSSPQLTSCLLTGWGRVWDQQWCRPNLGEDRACFAPELGSRTGAGASGVWPALPPPGPKVANQPCPSPTWVS